MSILMTVIPSVPRSKMPDGDCCLRIIATRSMKQLVVEVELGVSLRDRRCGASRQQSLRRIFFTGCVCLSRSMAGMSKMIATQARASGVRLAPLIIEQTVSTTGWSSGLIMASANVCSTSRPGCARPSHCMTTRVHSGCSFDVSHAASRMFVRAFCSCVWANVCV